jgi:CRP-like cAMP-binding protein
VLSGGVAITERRATGATWQAEREVGGLGVGDVFGEQALLEEALATMTLTAREPTRALFLPIWDFRAILRDCPDLAIHLIETLAHRSASAPPGEDQADPNIPP